MGERWAASLMRVGARIAWASVSVRTLVALVATEAFVVGTVCARQGGGGGGDKVKFRTETTLCST